MFGAAACTTEDVSNSVVVSGDTVTVTFTANLGQLGTRTATIGNASHVDRVYLGVYEHNNPNNYLNELTEDEGYQVVYDTAEGVGKASFSVVLLKDKVYDLVFWAQKADVDCYEMDWANRKLNIDYTNVASQAEERDAFFLVENDYKAGDAAETTTFTLKRPFAQLNAGLSADEVTNLKNNGVIIKNEATGEDFTAQFQSKAVVSNVATTLLLGQDNEGLVANPEDVTFLAASWPAEALVLADQTAYTYVSMNYLLVNEQQLVEVAYEFTDNEGTTYNRDYSAVPVQRNFRTNIVGALLSSPIDFNVVIDPGFTTPDFNREIVHVANTTELQAAINAASTDANDPTEIILSGDIDLNDLLASLSSTRAEAAKFITVPAGKSLILNLNGCTLSATDDTEKNYGLIMNNGNLTIKDATGQGKMIVEATVNSGWNRYSAVISNNPGATLVVDGGTIEHLGGTDMAYGIDILTNGGIGDVKATINGGHIKSTYRAVRQFLNSSSKKNELIINGGILEAPNKSIFFHDPSANANNGTLLVAAEAQLKGDVYLFVTAGSTEWPVEVEIASAALVDGSAVLTGNIPEGYGVAEVNGKWINFEGVAYGVTCEGNTYSINNIEGLKWLATTTKDGNNFAGKTVQLTTDIDLNNEEWSPIGSFNGVFDGQNHTIKNLVVTGYNSTVGLFSSTYGEVKNLTVENAKVSGRLNVGVVAGNPYTSKYTNITVKGHVEVNGMAYVGAVGGKNAYANWTDVTVNVDATSYVKANSVENGTAYRTYVGGVVGFNGEGGHTFKNITSNINVEGSTCDVGGLFGIAHYENKFENCVCTGNVAITNASEAEDAQEMGGIAGVWHPGGGNVVMTNCSFTGTLSANVDGVEFYYNGLVGKPYNTTGTGKLIIDGVAYSANEATKTPVTTAEELVAALAKGENVLLMNDITIAATSGGYNKAGILQNNAQLIDGGNHTLTVTGAGATWDCAIYTNGGIIKNLTVAGAMRGIFTAGQNTDLYISNVVFKNVIYTFNSDDGNSKYGVYVTNSVVNGWTSHSNVHKEVVYTNCSFGEGSGYKFCRPYGPTSFVGCTFCPGYTIDQSKCSQITFTDCIFEE